MTDGSGELGCRFRKKEKKKKRISTLMYSATFRRGSASENEREGRRRQLHSWFEVRMHSFIYYETRGDT